MKILCLLTTTWLLASCAAGSGELASPTDLPTASPTASKAAQEDQPGDGDMVLTGTVNSDPIEGGCTYLETDDGTRYELIPDREAGVAPLPIGSVVTVRGVVATDMASICMIGPIFRVSEVLEIESP